MNRPEVRNAQSWQMIREMDQAFNMAAADPEVRVIILAGAGPRFSAGHDLGSAAGRKERAEHPIPPGVEGRMKHEEDIYLNPCLRWRDIPKPTIAQVQGYSIIGGYMVAAACDVIIASEDAQFADVAVRWAAPSGEFFSHVWDFGPRKTKEMLFTGDFISAQEAHRLGFVNRVVPRDKLDEETMKLARRIAQQNPFLLKLAKKAVNETVDGMGFRETQQRVFYMHQCAHAHLAMVGPQVPTVEGESVREWARRRDSALEKK